MASARRGRVNRDPEPIRLNPLAIPAGARCHDEDTLAPGDDLPRRRDARAPRKVTVDEADPSLGGDAERARERFADVDVTGLRARTHRWCVGLGARVTREGDGEDGCQGEPQPG